MQPFYQLNATTASGQLIDFKELEGKVVLIVNTATKCGFTPQLDGLEKLYLQYKDQGLVILGFPCDQFGHQNPESDNDIETVCKLNYGVTFPLMKKSDVNGSHTNPVFQYLKKELTGTFGSRIKWNFTKFLIDRGGKPVKRFAPFTKPDKMKDEVRRVMNYEL